MNTQTPIAIQTVRWQYQNDASVLIATGRLLEEKDDFLQVEIVRDGKPSGVIVTIPRAHVLVDQALIAEPALKEKFKFGTPSDRQLAMINTFLPNGAPPLTTDELVTVPFIAADNLLNRGLDRWDLDSLATMAQLLPGLPCLLDHDWDDTSKEWGRIYSAEFVQSRTAPAAALNRAGNFDSNRQVVGKEGFAQVVFEVFALTDSPVVRALRRGHSGKISTGGFQFKDYVCPLCEASFDDDQCPHVPPDPAWGVYPNAVKGITSYAIRTGLYDMGEASIVTIPNLPNTGVI